VFFASRLLLLTEHEDKFTKLTLIKAKQQSEYDTVNAEVNALKQGARRVRARRRKGGVFVHGALSSLRRAAGPDLTRAPHRDAAAAPRRARVVPQAHGRAHARQIARHQPRLGAPHPRTHARTHKRVEHAPLTRLLTACALRAQHAAGDGQAAG
jgi:hypothetical protein